MIALTLAAETAIRRAAFRNAPRVGLPVRHSSFCVPCRHMAALANLMALKVDLPAGLADKETQAEFPEQM